MEYTKADIEDLANTLNVEQHASFAVGCFEAQLNDDAVINKLISHFHLNKLGAGKAGDYVRSICEIAKLRLANKNHPFNNLKIRPQEELKYIQGLLAQLWAENLIIRSSHTGRPTSKKQARREEYFISQKANRAKKKEIIEGAMKTFKESKKEIERHYKVWQNKKKPIESREHYRKSFESIIEESNKKSSQVNMAKK